MNAAAVTALVVVLCAAAPAPTARGSQRRSDPAKALFDYKLRAARADTAHARTVERAVELATIAGELARRYGARRALGAGDRRSIEQIRKLARQVRADLGGMGEHKLDPPPRSVGEAVAAIEERSGELREQLERSTRFELNARLITLAGEVVALSDAIKALGRRAR